MREQLPTAPIFDVPDPSRTARRLTFAALALLCLLTALTMAAGYANKARCTGPEFDEWGRSEPSYQERSYRDGCYSDIQNLWLGRDMLDFYGDDPYEQVLWVRNRGPLPLTISAFNSSSVIKRG